MHSDFKLFIDSAELAEVSYALKTGFVHGVTTNPTILEKANKTVADIAALCNFWKKQKGAQEVFFQAWGSSAADYIATGERIAALGAGVKVPATTAGLQAAAKLVEQGHTVLVTAVYTSAQALAARLIGARYIAPYLGRLGDRNLGGIATIAHMQELLSGSDCGVLAASVRSEADFWALLRLGVAAVTIQPPLFRQLFAEPEATTEDTARFAASSALQE